ncbi:unnamed protein product [Sphagnum troendelagicum]|uniref:SH3 domain-containing protein n=1 Tax=Sphagnum troendelagicum TaxID=128251 RepID=A0ABP0TKY5_9BRYO
MAGSQETGTSLMDLITADPAPPGNPAFPPLGVNPTPDRTKPTPPRKSTSQPPTTDLLVSNKAPTPTKSSLAPLKQKRKPVSYSQLARALQELALATDQKSSHKLLHQVFPKLAVYSSVDPSLAPSLLKLHEQAEDRQVLRYVYYFLARLLAESGAQGVTPGGGIPTPNWDALADLNLAGGTVVTRAEVVPLIIAQLTAEATNPDPAVHPRRIAALKALSFAPTSSNDILATLYEIVFGILDKVHAGKLRRKKGIFGRQSVDKESALRSNLQYAALSTLRRLPLDSGNPAFLHRAVQGISCADPVGVRHALSVVTDLAGRDMTAVAMAVAKHALAGGSLQEVLQIHDVLARVYLARLCYLLSRAHVLDERPEVKSQFTTILYQLLLDPSERVCFEAITCILGKFDTSESLEDRASGWGLLTTAILKFPEPPSVPTKDANAAASKDGNAQKEGIPPRGPKDRQAPKPRRPQPLIKLVMRRLDSALRSPSRPVLHGAVRIVQELGKSRAASIAVRGYTVDDVIRPDDSMESADAKADEDGDTEVPRTKAASTARGEESIASMLASLMEAVRTMVACECVYVRAAAIKALIWMQSPYDSVDELKAIITGELADSSWPASLLNDIVLTLHARFKASPEMAVILLDISRLFATKVPGKIDADVLQLLWKTCLIGSGPDGKHTALEAVTVVLDLPPPPPLAMTGGRSVDRADPKSAIALQRLVQAAVWFLGENANYAAAEYAWESTTSPSTALMMLDGDKMVAAASSRNPTLAGAVSRLERCAISGSWEVRIITAQALVTIAIRSGEPYRLQIYEFLHTLALGRAKDKVLGAEQSNGEDQGASGSGLSSIIAPMLRVLDEMYKGQDQLIKDMRQHDNSKEEWTDDDLRRLYETHERLLDLVSLFCFVPRSKYLPLGPTSARLINLYRNKHRIDATVGTKDPAVAQGISDLLDNGIAHISYPPVHIETAQPPLATDEMWAANQPGMDLVNDFLVGGGTDAPEEEEDEDEVEPSRPSVTYDDMWAKTLLDASDEDDEGQLSESSSPESTASSKFDSSRFPSLFSGGPFSHPTRRTSGRKVSPFSRMDSMASDSPAQDSPRQSVDDGQSDDTRQEPQFGRALYDFTAGGDEELNLTAGEEVEIEYEVDGWFSVRKKRPGRDGKLTGLVPVLYVTT